ncbi:RluA family pseudouridine synthase [Bacillus testis]|uniref:RluA family pseudouridine synthase n=1 Tax=Bacillus testis TaxID=1622072 RepID=UPI00067EAB86|nr:RluA family pseudouridine synthase [Bacillus testis]
MIQCAKKGKFLEITVPKEWRTLTVDTLLREKWKAPKKMVHEWRMEKSILLNGEAAQWNTLLKPNDKLLIPVFEEVSSDIVPCYMDLMVLYEDEHLMVLNKPAGIETHPSQPGQIDSLLNGAAYIMQAAGETGELRHIHRLDQDTTGAILFSKHALAGALLQRMLDERKIKRTYRALVHGAIDPKEGTITANIGKDRHHATRRRVSPTGQPAVTHYRTLHYDPAAKLSLVECRLDTGRTHQIRVHLSSIGHPLAGDRLYGGTPIFPRQALHAAKLEFVHPLTEAKLTIEAPYLDDPSIFADK